LDTHSFDIMYLLERILLTITVQVYPFYFLQLMLPTTITKVIHLSS